MGKTCLALVIGLALCGVCWAAAEKNIPPGAVDPTGLNLGVEVYPTAWGMKLSGLLNINPNPARAAGFKRGDIIMAFRVREANGSVTTYPTLSLKALREAKSAIGPDRRVYVKVWRPRVGYWFPIVTFKAGTGPAVAAAPTDDSKSIFKDVQTPRSPGENPPDKPGETPPE